MTKTTINSFLKYVKNGEGIYMLLAKLGLKNKDPDEKYLSHLFQAHMGVHLNLDEPKTFNEKIQWLKIHDRKASYTKMVDKYEVKKYVSSIIGPSYIIPNYGVWDSFKEIQFNNLPNQFVLKCTHDSNSVFICNDKSKFNYKKIEEAINKRLKTNHFLRGREWAYKDVKPRIIAEKLLIDPVRPVLTDYKIFCFDGVPQLIMTANGSRDDESSLNRRMYDLDWNLMNIGLHGKDPLSNAEEKPVVLPQMLEISRKLSKGIPLLRVDLYVIETRIFFGELTFYHSCGFEEFVPNIWDSKLGEMIHLDLIKDDKV